MDPTATTRLSALADLVPRSDPGPRVADIGSGHGKLPRRLLAGGRASHCIATELTPWRLRDVAGFPPDHRLARRLELRWGDGLTALVPEDRVDVATIAGLGGPAIVSILERGRRLGLLPRRLVVQPQTAAGGVRHWLGKHGFAIVDERLVLERRRFYVVIAARNAGGPPPWGHPGIDREVAREAGPCLVASGDPLVRRYWAEQARRLSAVLDGAVRGEDRDRALRDHRLALRVLETLHRLRS